MNNKPVEAYNLGKYRVQYLGQTINTTLYIDTIGLFCMIKGKRKQVYRLNKPLYKNGKNIRYVTNIEAEKNPLD